MLRLPRKMTTEIYKMLRLPRKLQLILLKRRESIAPATQNDFRRIIKQVGMSQSAAPTLQNKIYNHLTPSKRKGFAASPEDTARPQENQRLETRHVGASKRAFRADFLRFSHFVASKAMFSYEISHNPLNLLPQNRYFVQGFRQVSSHLTRCHACHGICTLSPLDAALTMRFAKNMQHDTSKVLRLPRKMTMDTSKVLHLPRKLQLILRKRRKSIAPATQNDFRHVTKHV